MKKTLQTTLADSVSAKPILFASLLALWSVPVAQAQTWQPANGGSWNSTANWSPATIPDSSTAQAVLSKDFTASPVPITLDRNTAFTVNKISYDDTGSSGDVGCTISAGTGSPAGFIFAGTTPTVDVGADLTISVPVNVSAAGLTKTGSRNLFLNGAVTGFGASVYNSVNAGMLVIGTATSLDWTTINKTSGNGTLRLDAVTTFTAPATFSVGAGELQINPSSGTFSFNAAGFTKSGGGVLRLVRDAAGPGGSATLAVTGGNLACGGNLSGFASGSVSSGATLQVNGSVTYGNIPLTITGAGASGTQGALFFNNGGNASPTWPGSITLGSGGATLGSYGVAYSTTLSGGISGTGPLTIMGRGGNTSTHNASFNVTSTAWSYSGNTFLKNNDGVANTTLKLGLNNGLPTPTVLTLNIANSAVATGVTFDLGGYNQQLAGLAKDTVAASTKYRVLNSSATASTLSVNNATDMSFDGLIGVAGSANLNLIKQGAARLTLGGANAYTGNTTVSQGTLALGATGSMANSPVLTVASGATLDVSALSGGFSLSASQTLGGSGVVTGAVSVASGGQIIPGGTGTVGTLSFSNSLTLGGNAMVFDLPGSGANDSIAVAGTLTLNGDLNIGLNYLNGSLPAGRYVLVSYASKAGSGNVSLNALYRNVSLVADDTSIAVVVGSGGSPANLVWGGDGISNVWDVNATTNWLCGGTPDKYFEGDSVTFDDSGSASPAINVSGPVSPGAIVFSNVTKNYTLAGSGKISGATGLTKQGNGTLILANSGGNDYSGVTTLSGGKLQIGNGDATGSLGTGNVSVTTAGTTLAFNRTDAITVANSISGGSSAQPNIQVNSGTVSLGGSSDNAYAVATVNNNGTLVLAKASTASIHALGGGSTALTISTGGTARLGGSGGDQIYDGQNIQLNGGTFDLNGMNETVGRFSGYGTIVNSGSAATLTLGGTANSGGALYPSGGTLTLASGTVSVAGTWNQNFGVAGGTTFDLAGGTVNSGSYFTVGNGNGSGRAFMTARGGTFSSTAEFLAGFQRPATVTVSGTAALNLNYYSFGDGTANDTTNWFNGGTVTLTLFNNRGSSPAWFYFNGTTFRGASSQSSWLAGAGNISALVSTNGLTVDCQSYNLTISQPLVHDPALDGAVDGGLNKSAGSGSLILTTNNTYTGLTRIGAGTLQLGNGGTSGSIASDVVNNGSLVFNRADDVLFTNAISGTGSLTKSATTGLLLLTASNSYSGVTTIAGSSTAVNALRIANSFALGTGSMTVGSGGNNDQARLELAGGITLTNAFATWSSRNTAAPNLVNVSETNTVTAAISGGSGGGQSTLQSDAGKLIMTGPCTTRLLNLQGAGDGDYQGPLNMAANGLVKSGAGTWILSGSNSYTGTTAVNGGTLLVNGVIPANTVNVAANATLGGVGLIYGPVTVQSGGALSPGAASLGNLTVSNTVALNGTLVMELNRDLSPAADLLTANSLACGGALVVTNTGAVLQGGDTFSLFNTTNQTGTFAATNLPALAAGQNWWTPDNFATLTVNQLTANPVILTRAPGTSLKVRVADVLANVTSVPAGDSFTLAGVGPSANGATVTTDGARIYYTPVTGAASNANDSFTYMVTSTRGGTVTGTINVNVVGAVGPVAENVAVNNGTANITFYGIPGYTYVVQTTTNSLPTTNWWNVSTNTAGANGQWLFTDPNATNTQQFYRPAQP